MSKMVSPNLYEKIKTAVGHID